MSQRLSTSATFQSLETRVSELEEVTPLPATLENNNYLSAKTGEGVVTRIAGITPSNALYFGGIDAAINSVVVVLAGSSSIELTSLGTTISGSLTVTNTFKAPLISAPSPNGNGGSVEILGSGLAGYTGIIQFHKLDGTRNGFVGFNADSGPMHYGSDTGAGHYFEGGVISPDPNMHFGLRFNSVDGIIDFDANDYLYYSRSNDEYLFMIGGSTQLALSGGGLQVSNVFTVGDGNFGMSLNGSSPYIAFDNTDFLGYNRSSNIFSFNIGNSSKAQIDGYGNVSTAGFIYPSSDSNFWLGLLSGPSPAINFDASDFMKYDRTNDMLSVTIAGINQCNIGAGSLAIPGTFLGGAIQIGDANFTAKLVSGNPQITFDSGDNITFERTLNKFLFMIGGVVVASIDASGNMRLKGTLTQSVTP